MEAMKDIYYSSAENTGSSHFFTRQTNFMWSVKSFFKFM